jgi:two-component system sensor histidine kinase KdpD
VRNSIPRLAISVGLIVALLMVCLRLRHVDHATVALLLVLAVVGLATMWGRAEALTGAIVGGIGLEYYFLPPPGFSFAAPEHWVALAAFLITALATGQLAARLNRRRIEAVEQQGETDRLYRLVNGLLESGSTESTFPQLADTLVKLFGASGVALYDQHTGRIIRSGPRATAISDQALLETATSGRQVEDDTSALSLAPVRHGGELVGSFGICGSRLSGPLLSAVAGRVGLGLARLYAIENTNEAEAARRSDELKSAVLDAMAHEVRNPLNSIKIAATTLLSEHAGNEMHKREMLTIINEEVNRMDRLLDNSVQIARGEAKQLSLKKEPQNFARLISAAIEDIGELASRRPIQVSVPESLPPAECDKDMIVHVIKQLLSNALKYSPHDSSLAVSAEFTGEAIVIDVVDRGPGVDDQERDRIFEKYYRGRAARLGTPGTGLGLASARSIVQAHGGEIWMTSPPAGGAAFHISLPVRNGPPPAGGG